MLKWLKADQTPRWWIITAALITLFVQHMYWSQSRQDTASQNYKVLVEGRTTEIRLVAIDFQGYAGAFVSSVLEQKNDVDTHRTALLESILKQYAAVELSEQLYKNGTVPSGDAYKQALTELSALLPMTTNVLNMAPFWEATSNVMLTRDNFLKKLSQQSSAS